MIRRILHKFYRWVKNYEEQDCIMVSNKISSVSEHMFDDNPIRFSVTTARGGIVVTSSTYDRVKDRNFNIVHVIHDNEDVAKRVGEIVALELMKA